MRVRKWLVHRACSKRFLGVVVSTSRGGSGVSVRWIRGRCQDGRGRHLFRRLAAGRSGRVHPRHPYFAGDFSVRPLTDRGSTFGVGAIVNNVSAEAFGKHLDRIVPRLFRYRFDPSAKTRSAMDQLWRSVVGEGSSGGDFSAREKEVTLPEEGLFFCIGGFFMCYCCCCC